MVDKFSEVCVIVLLNVEFIMWNIGFYNVCFELCLMRNFSLLMFFFWIVVDYSGGLNDLC